MTDLSLQGMRKFLMLAMPFFILSLVAGAASPHVAAAAPAFTVDARLKIHPFLQAITSANPTGTVRVIVQKTTAGGDVAKLATTVQGRVVSEFRVLPAFVLEVSPAK